jgi:hypothetical protein
MGRLVDAIESALKAISPTSTSRESSGLKNRLFITGGSISSRPLVKRRFSVSSLVGLVALDLPSKVCDVRFDKGELLPNGLLGRCVLLSM